MSSPAEAEAGASSGGDNAADDQRVLLVSAMEPAGAASALSTSPSSSSLAPAFRQLPTVPAALVGILANVVMVLLVFLLPIFCLDRGPDPQPICPLQPFSILVYSHCGHWIIHLIVDQFLKFQHKKSRVSGYIEFYLTTKNIRRTPFYLVSVGNAVLLITVTTLHEVCDPNKCPDRFMKVDYLRGLITLECLIIICLWGNYIINVRAFHAAANPPDVLREEVMKRLMMTSSADADADEEHDVSSMPAPPNDEEVVYGMRPPRQDTSEEVREKQAELIRYLQAHIEKQNVKLLDLVQRLDRQRYEEDNRF